MSQYRRQPFYRRMLFKIVCMRDSFVRGLAALWRAGKWLIVKNDFRIIKNKFIFVKLFELYSYLTETFKYTRSCTIADAQSGCTEGQVQALQFKECSDVCGENECNGDNEVEQLFSQVTEDGIARNLSCYSCSTSADGSECADFPQSFR